MAKTLYEQDLIQQQKQIEKMKNDPEIKAILTNFPDIKIHSITNISETFEENKSTDLSKETKEV